MPDTSFRTAMEVLSRLLVPRELLIVGAGRGVLEAELPKALDARVVLVDANDELEADLRRRAALRHGWSSCVALLGECSSQARELHLTNNANADGLIAGAGNVRLWPNLQARSTRVMPSDTADALTRTLGMRHVDWLMVDCLSAWSVLAGAEVLLGSAQVLVVRTVDNVVLDDAQAASQQQMFDALEGRGWAGLSAHATNHPRIQLRIFARRASLPEQQDRERIGRIVDWLCRRSQRPLRAMLTQGRLDLERAQREIDVRQAVILEGLRREQRLEERAQQSLAERDQAQRLLAEREQVGLEAERRESELASVIARLTGEAQAAAAQLQESQAREQDLIHGQQEQEVRMRALRVELERLEEQLDFLRTALLRAGS